ncbi:putative Trp operon repressor (plasmid) [Pseudarthrobacter chlorophenolicus A6]|uniref:Trp operon repressor n=1 Tax=Pseudarthrobacter chlorophenolicus (strain ATCC 700700 / DSM 12829 / CIP 107037 / JCM 12360 / KCTC 9906 / NCIMB 13794 / A6) TaxID=452863 RepID=B8HIX1_PSECP|nr:DUF2637 domain-containing protein [Pseudarthrobacter chlorophenolicus]ACL42368.1 putative Trp operon repressor [Pseudarthrobacter chlorophenolicus A6]SDQ17158.1 Protein of unknown function [Pseudarthrobacter chlorophenolicus]
MTSRIEPDSRTMVMLSLALVGVLALASFTLSFLGLIQAAAWAGIPEYLRWLVPIVVDSTILVYAVAASVQRARGESTTLSWMAVAFFTLVSVLANGAHVLAPSGVARDLDSTVIFGAFLAAIMPVSLFFATETTVNLVVAPAYGSVAQRRKRARDQLVHADRMDHGKDHWTTSGGPRKGPLGGPANGPGVDHLKDHLRSTPKMRPEVDPQKIRELASGNLSQRAIAQQLGVSKTTVARALSGAREPASAH